MLQHSQKSQWLKNSPEWLIDNQVIDFSLWKHATLCYEADIILGEKRKEVREIYQELLQLAYEVSRKKTEQKKQTEKLLNL